MITELSVNSDKELAELIGEVEVSRIGPSNWNWNFEFKRISIFESNGQQKPAWLLWATFNRIDYTTGEPGRGRGREFIIYPGSARSGVVKTLWMNVETIVRHELFHAFRYKGKELFDPHAPIDLLHKISGMAAEDAFPAWKSKPNETPDCAANKEIG